MTSSCESAYAVKQHKTTHPRPWLVRFRFRPGVSGNPAGRPKRETATGLLYHYLDEPVDPFDPNSPTNLERLVEVLVNKAISGNIRAAKMILDRVDPIVHHYVVRSPRVNAPEHNAYLLRIRNAAAQDGE